MKILTIDIGNKSGWAFLDGDDIKKAKSGYHELKINLRNPLHKKHKDYIKKYLWYEHINHLIQTLKPDCVYHEGLIKIAKYNTGKTYPSLYAKQSILELLCCKHDIPCVDVPLREIKSIIDITTKKYASRSQKPSKALVTIFLANQGHYFQSEDEADAFLILFYLVKYRNNT